jgi:hypothetical protein
VTTVAGIGQIVDRRITSSNAPLQVRLLGGKQTVETTPDSRGRFTFENLDPGIYQVQVVQAPLTRAADLTTAWCAMVVLPVGP